MKKSFLLTAASALVALPLAVSAETINLYGWQNHSWEFVEETRGDVTRDSNRIQANAANIGFAASVDTGMNGIHVNLQCEQFTYVNQFAGGTGWCNRNSKIALAHPTLGEVMFATWLLPYNEAVAQWVDPFYDAGADSHTSIMGSVGAFTIFYNTGQFEASSSGGSGEFNYGAVNFDQGFNRRQENIIQYWSPNVNGFVFRYAQTVGNRDEGFINMNTATSNLDPVIRSTSLAYENGPFWAAATYQEHEDWAAAGLGGMESSDAESYRFAARYIMDLGDGMSIQISAMYEDLEYDFRGAAGTTTQTLFDTDVNSDGETVLVQERDENNNLRFELDDAGVPTTTPIYATSEVTEATGISNAMTAFGYSNFASFSDPDPMPFDGMPTRINGAGLGDGNITFEREAFLISGKVKFGGPLDFRFSYMDADDLEVSCVGCTGEWDETAADAWNVGLYYTMPAGTELRLTYSEVDNDDQGTYGQGISGTGLGQAGGEVEMIAVGIVHWFD